MMTKKSSIAERPRSLDDEFAEIAVRRSRLLAESDAQRMADRAQAEAQYTATENASPSPMNATRYRMAVERADWLHGERKAQIQAEHSVLVAQVRREAQP